MKKPQKEFDKTTKEMIKKKTGKKFSWSAGDIKIISKAGKAR